MMEEGFTLNRQQIVALFGLAYELPGDTVFNIWELSPTPVGPNNSTEGREAELFVDAESEIANATGIRRKRWKLPKGGGKIASATATY